MSWSRAPSGTGVAPAATEVLRVLVVDPDAAGHARCHLALRGLRIGPHAVQLLHARSLRHAADLLVLHRDVAVAVIGDGVGGRRLTADDGHPLWTILLTATRADAGSDAVDAVVAGPDPDGRALHAAVVAGLRRPAAVTVATAVGMG